jgi:hypothetical protein
MEFIFAKEYPLISYCFCNENVSYHFQTLNCFTNDYMAFERNAARKMQVRAGACGLPTATKHWKHRAGPSLLCLIHW